LALAALLLVLFQPRAGAGQIPLRLVLLHLLAAAVAAATALKATLILVYIQQEWQVVQAAVDRLMSNQLGLFLLADQAHLVKVMLVARACLGMGISELEVEVRAPSGLTPRVAQVGLLVTVAMGCKTILKLAQIFIMRVAVVVPHIVLKVYLLTKQMALVVKVEARQGMALQVVLPPMQQPTQVEVVEVVVFPRELGETVGLV